MGKELFRKRVFSEHIYFKTKNMQLVGYPTVSLAMTRGRGAVLVFIRAGPLKYSIPNEYTYVIYPKTDRTVLSYDS